MLYGIIHKPNNIIARTFVIPSGDCEFSPENLVLSDKEPISVIGFYETGSVFIHEDLNLIHEVLETGSARIEGVEGNIVCLSPHLDRSMLDVVVISRMARELGRQKTTTVI